MKQVVINFDKFGRATIDAQGFKGKSCEDATQVVEVAIGGAAEKKKKPEFYMPEGIGQQNTNRRM